MRTTNSAPFIGLAVHSNRAAVRLHDFLDQVQPQPVPCTWSWTARRPRKNGSKMCACSSAEFPGRDRRREFRPRRVFRRPPRRREDADPVAASVPYFTALSIRFCSACLSAILVGQNTAGSPAAMCFPPPGSIRPARDAAATRSPRRSVFDRHRFPRRMTCPASVLANCSTCSTWRPASRFPPGSVSRSAPPGPGARRACRAD